MNMKQCIPSNANPQEEEAAKALEPLAEYISWNEDGHVYDIDLGGSRLSDEQWLLLRRFTYLTGLNLIGSQIDDEDLKRLEGFAEMRGLGLAWTPITDEGLKHLIVLRNLRVLDLNHTNITDKGLAHLEQLPHLFHVSAEGTRITEDGVERFKKALPNCLVQTTGIPHGSSDVAESQASGS